MFARTRWAVSAALVLLATLSGCSDDGDRAVKQDGQVVDLAAPEMSFPHPDVLPSDIFSVPDEPFGRVCTNLGAKCTAKDKYGYGLDCIALAGTMSGKGFCSRKCTVTGIQCNLSTNGTMAACIVEAGVSGDVGVRPRYCAFICEKDSQSYKCPPTLGCDKPNSQGLAICKPF